MFFILFIGLIGILSIVWTTWRYGIGPTPTSPKVRKALFPLLPKEITGTIYELGAGWGTLAFSLADRYPQAKIIAVEVSPLPYFWMLLQQWLTKKPNLKIVWGDFFQMNFADANFLVCYLYPGAMQLLEAKIQKECPLATVATHTFAFPHMTPLKEARVNDLYHTPIFIYQFKNL